MTAASTAAMAAMTLVEMGSKLVDVQTSFTLERALTLLDGLMARADQADTPGLPDDPAPHD